jgi:hypothetical protein
MCSTPDRISEILTLRADCEHYHRLPDGQEVYGLRYWPAKGADPMIKYVIPSMVDLVKDAIFRIRQITESSRELARWYESHPKQLYLREHLEYLRDNELTLEEVSEVLYGSPHLTREAKSWLARRKVKIQGARSVDLRVQFSTLEKELIDLLPDGFSNFRQKFRAPLFGSTVHRTNFFSSSKREIILICGLATVTHGQIADGLGASLEHGKSSVFSRLGICDSGGEAIRINTHKFRHYLNTLAMQGGLSELDIAKWSGRKDVRQNRAYDHVSARDKLALIRDAIGDQSKMFGPLGNAPSTTLRH